MCPHTVYEKNQTLTLNEYILNKTERTKKEVVTNERTK